MHSDRCEGVTPEVNLMRGEKIHLRKLNRLIMMGVPGSGKGTFARLLRNDLNNINIINVGDLIQDNIKRMTGKGL